jgi:hypothetical protein
MSIQCPNCQFIIPHVEKLKIGLPVLPLFSYAETCALVPARYSTLRKIISKNRHLFELRYTGPRGRSRRLFSAEEVRTLRSLLVRGRR